MNVILLSGGSGKRLWPLSNEIRSKQFIKIFKNQNGVYESMIQRVYREIHNVDTDAVITVATSKEQVSALHNQIGEDINISVEPCRRDTFPAIALSTAYMHDVLGISDEETVVVCPVDPYVDKDYFEAVFKLARLAEKETHNLSLLGITPTYPSEKYGYIIPAGTDNVVDVLSFKEKPDAKTAAQYISKGALWNGGVFAYKIKYVLNIAKDIFGSCDYRALYERYEELKRISFDYAVVENEKKIQVLRFSGRWDDLGTWSSLSEAMEDSSLGKSIIDDNCTNIHVINELDIPVISTGINNAVVVASPDGILVADKESSERLKSLVDKTESVARFSEEAWGTYHILDITEKSLTMKLIVKPFCGLTLVHSGNEYVALTIISGNGTIAYEGTEKSLESSDIVQLKDEGQYIISAKDIEMQIIRTLIER